MHVHPMPPVQTYSMVRMNLLSCSHKNKTRIEKKRTQQRAFRTTSQLHNVGRAQCYYIIDGKLESRTHKQAKYLHKLLSTKCLHANCCQQVVYMHNDHKQILCFCKQIPDKQMCCKSTMTPHCDFADIPDITAEFADVRTSSQLPLDLDSNLMNCLSSRMTSKFIKCIWLPGEVSLAVEICEKSKR